MELRECGRSGLKLPVLGLGCWEFGGGEYWGERHDQSEVDAVVRRAFELGVTYFDTAEVYNDGRSEESLGHALRGLPRDRVVIGTKVSPAHVQPDVLPGRANPDVACTLVGSRSVEKLEANVRAVEHPLPARIVARLNAITDPLKQRLGPSFDYYESPENDRTRSLLTSRWPRSS